MILHDSSITLFNLNTGSTHDNVVKLDKKPISMEVNSHVLAVLDQSNDVHIFSMTGKQVKQINYHVLSVFVINISLFPMTLNIFIVTEDTCIKKIF